MAGRDGICDAFASWGRQTSHQSFWALIPRLIMRQRIIFQNNLEPGNARPYYWWFGKYFSPVFHGKHCTALFSELESDLYQIWRGHRPIISSPNLRFTFQIMLLRFATRAPQTRLGSKIEALFGPCKNWTKCSSHCCKISLRPNLWCTFGVGAIA